MASKAIRKKGKKYQPPIPLAEAKKIINDVNSHKKEKGVSPPFKDQGYAISQLLSTIDLYNQTVDSLITNPTLTPKKQKDYYNKLNKRVSGLLKFLLLFFIRVSQGEGAPLTNTEGFSLWRRKDDLLVFLRSPDCIIDLSRL
jgi:hypothetical protein|tara:strand:- start:2420 stop:2845 length:426 start_codon:yes stop_codon:yes gene_type:complete